MKKLLVLFAAASCLTGCAMMQKIGVGPDTVEAAVKQAVMIAVAREGLDGIVTEEMVDEVIDILISQERLAELANQVAAEAVADPELVQRATDLIREYQPNVVVPDPLNYNPETHHAPGIPKAPVQ
jgi:hypothetical protein